MTKRFLILGMMFGLTLAPGRAHGWWNDEWTSRKAIRLDPAGAGVQGPIGSMAMLVRLHSGNFKFETAKEDGSDVRFVASDEKTPLKYQIEKWDSLMGEALVWVGLPEVQPGAPTQIWMYWGNPKAAHGEDARGTWDSDAVLVYHFADKGAPPRDSSAAGNTALGPASTTDGALIGPGLKLDGLAPVGLPALGWTAGSKMTWSAWVRPAASESTGIVFSMRDGRNAILIGLRDGKPYVQIGDGTGERLAEGSTAIPAGTWHHVAVTCGERIALVVDGAHVADTAGPLPLLLGRPAWLGGDPEAPEAAKGAKGARRVGPAVTGFVGELDELEISKAERTEGYLRLAALTQGTDPGKVVVAGQDEQGGGASTGYFAVIIRSVTIDGWVVIALLAIMAAVSWVVMVNKAAYLSAAERANAVFLERFRHVSADLVGLSDAGQESQLGDVKALAASPLYRIFEISSEETLKRTKGGKALSAEAIEAIRASLDAGSIREGQRMTKGMVLLTIAISGGPFLGLLGTVVGVMITFAAIAAAGDVNVNAIAPGIAAALVATVAGLAVAIPALFGYNWLLTRVKEANATTAVFIDELTTRLAEVHSSAREPRADPEEPVAIAMGDRR